MQELIDKDNSLSWKKVGNHDMGVCDRERTMLNFWASPDIKKYLTDRYPIGELFHTYMGGNSSICYCYIDKQSIPNLDIDGSPQVSKELAGAVLLYNPFAEGDALSVEAMVVNPRLVRRGIATSMIASIKDNPEFFGNELHTGKVMAAAHKENIASQKVFLKNRFKVMKKCPYGYMDKCLVYFEYERQKEK